MLKAVNHFLPFSLWFNAFLILIALSIVLHALFCFFGKKFNNFYLKTSCRILSFLYKAGKAPLILFIVLYLIYFSLLVVNYYAHNYIYARLIHSFVVFIEFSAFLLFLFNSVTLFQLYISNQIKAAGYVNIHIFLAKTGNSIKTLLFIIIINSIVPLLNINEKIRKVIESSIDLLLIGMIGWIVIQIINSIEQVIINKIKFDEKYFDNRKRITQVIILKKSILLIITFITISSMLMVFDSVRNLGAGLLTTAGVLGAAGAFASQRSLSSLFSGLKIAFTQPIAIGDKVVIENEFGQVEDITFSYVVIKLWDLRRLILPTDYFINKSVFNLSSSATPELLGTIFFYLDYTIPIEALREKFNEILSLSPTWDKKTSALQVTDLKEHCVEIRAMIGTANGDDLWNLRCEVREKLLEFVVANFPQALPRVRYTVDNSESIVKQYRESRELGH